MEGKTVLITGATSGIGKVTAIELAKQGATILFNARDDAKGRRVQEEIIYHSGNSKVELYRCDLSLLRSVRNFADAVNEKHNRLDVIINNAGVWEPSRTLSKDGIENTFAVNHLSHFLLTYKLLDLLKKNGPARIINVSSGMHKRASLDLNDVEMKNRPYKGLTAYANSKLCNVLFTAELARRLKNTSVKAYTLHPGWIATRIDRKAPLLMRMMIGSMASHNLQRGAATTLYLASTQEIQAPSGEYFVRAKVARSSKAAQDASLAANLWKLSLNYCREYV